MKLVVVDLEMDAPGTPDEAIIQLGAVQLDCRSGVIDAPFRRHVRIGKPIDDFIQKLTGITQAQHDAAAQKVDDVLAEWWAYVGAKSVAAWGKDYWQLIELSKNIGVRYRINRSLDLKSVGELMRCALPGQLGKRGGLRPTMEAFGLEFVGRPHDALRDSYNTARLAWRWVDVVRAALTMQRRIGVDTTTAKMGEVEL